MVNKLSSMQNLLLTRQFRVFLNLLVLLVTVASVARADERFAVAVGAHDMLEILGPKGDKIAELPAPSISQPVTVGATSFQVSYGRDANNLLTAIIAPSPDQAQDLHFNVLNKDVDSDKQAVVTLTFSAGLNHVNIDPGYIGLVQVDSHKVRHRELADDTYTPGTTAATTRATPRMYPKNPTELAPPTSYEPAPPLPAEASGDPTATAYTDSSTAAADSEPPPSHPVYWSEPITSPSGAAPKVGIDQMKLVEVQGPVSVKTADGQIQGADEGMILPSGSTVLTTDGSSAAVFMGGVNSVRLLPNTDAQISQHLDGSVRKTAVDLHQGTVFSRVGRRLGETQDFEVRTPEGVAAARGTEFADYRGSYDNLLHSSHTNTAMPNKSQMLAWNPVSLAKGVISDIAEPVLTAALGGANHYVFVAKGVVGLIVDGKPFGEVTGGGGSAGVGGMPSSSHGRQVLQQILLMLQPFNTKLQGVLDRISNGSATEADITYYNNLKNTYTGNSDDNGPTPPYDPMNPNKFMAPVTSDSGYGGTVHGVAITPYDWDFFRTAIPPERRGLNQDFEPFGIKSLTPY